MTTPPDHPEAPPAELEATPAEDSGRAIRNTASLLASRAAIAVMGWLGTVVVARVLSPDDWGRFSFVFGVLGLMSIVTDLGVGRVVLARLMSEDDREVGRIAASFIALRLVLGFLGYAVAVLFVWLSGYPAPVVAATAVAGIVVVVATPSHALTVLYQSRLRLTYVAAAEMLGQFAQLAFTLFAALVAPVLVILVIPAVVNEIVGIIVKLRGVRRGDAGPPLARRAEIWRWKEMLIEAVPLSIGFALVAMMSKIDTMLLAQLDDFNSVGLYSIGTKFADLVMEVAFAVVTPFTTLMMAAWPALPHVFRDSVHRAGALIAAICATGLAAFWPVAGSLLTLFYGERFAPAASSTRLLIAGAALAALSQLVLMVLVSAGKHRTYPWVVLGALVVNVGLNVALIPRFSYHGAAWAMLISQFVLLAAVCAVARHSIGIKNLLPTVPALGCAALAFVVIFATAVIPGIGSLPWPLVAVLSATVTLAAAHALRLTGGVRILPVIRRLLRRRAGAEDST